MKKVIGLLLLLFILINANAQKCFEKGDILLNPSIGLGSNYAVGGFHPSLFFSADFGVHDYVSVGPYIGATFLKSGSVFNTGARGNFHFWQLIGDKVRADLKQDQLELYISLFLGVEVFGDQTGFDTASTFGLRWYPNANNRFALNGEFGYTPISYATIGCTIKIN